MFCNYPGGNVSLLGYHGFALDACTPAAARAPASRTAGSSPTWRRTLPGHAAGPVGVPYYALCRICESFLTKAAMYVSLAARFRLEAECCWRARRPRSTSTATASARCRSTSVQRTRFGHKRRENHEIHERHERRKTKHYSLISMFSCISRVFRGCPFPPVFRGSFPVISSMAGVRSPLDLPVSPLRGGLPRDGGDRAPRPGLRPHRQAGSLPYLAGSRDVKPFSYQEAPCLRWTPMNTGEQFKTPDTMAGGLLINCEVIVAGSCCDDLTNFWWMLTRCFYPPPALAPGGTRTSRRCRLPGLQRPGAVLAAGVRPRSGRSVLRRAGPDQDRNPESTQ